MTSSPDRNEELHAYLDGELDSSARAALESYLTSHPQAAERLAEYRQGDEAIRAHFAPVLDEPVPQQLRPPYGKSLMRWRRAAAMGWLALGAVAGWYLHDFQSGDLRSEAPDWARRAIVAHVVYSPEVRHPVEVGADQEAHLVAWLSKRLGTQLRVPHLGAEGFTLIGGRLLPGDQQAVAQFMYQDARGQRLTLYIRTNRDLYKETAFRFTEDGSVRVFYWIDRGLGYALSGEISKDDLLRVATAVYRSLNP